MRGDGGAEHGVQDRRGVVAEEQRVVEQVQLAVVLGLDDERQERLDVPVGHVDHVEADDPERDQGDALAVPVRAQPVADDRRDRLGLAPGVPDASAAAGRAAARPAAGSAAGCRTGRGSCPRGRPGSCPSTAASMTAQAAMPMARHHHQDPGTAIHAGQCREPVATRPPVFGRGLSRRRRRCGWRPRTAGPRCRGPGARRAAPPRPPRRRRRPRRPAGPARA